ncbi:SRPBCC family protein [Inquilinus sp. KBS0705]|nr:SRPBCC family protein [Inquilinus sp. KBS0705]
MAKIFLSTDINAPVQRCFDIARNIDIHLVSTAHTGETAIAGRTSGLIELGETVTWRAKHFGIWQTLTSKITAFQPPVFNVDGTTTAAFFEDRMVSGAFKGFSHGHHFSPQGNKTTMLDVFVFESPLGILGKFANWLFLKRYMTDLLERRNTVIKKVAESE